MTDEQKQADALNVFLDAYAAGEPVNPQTPEATLAADLVDLASSLPAPHAESLTRRPEQTRQTSAFSPIDAERVKEQHTMIARRQSASSWSALMPLVATLLLIFFIGALVPLAQMPSFAPPVQEPTRLPIAVGGYVGSIDPATMNTMRNAGMGWVGVQVAYEPADPDALIEASRALIDDAHLQDFRVWITLSTGRSTETTLEAFNARDGFARYAELAGQIAALGADAIQVWEEPNLSVSWPEQTLDPANYVELLRQSYEAIKAANPETLVVSAAPAPTGAQADFGSDQIWNDDLFYQAMASFGAADYLDCIGVRYIEGAIDPTLIEGDPRGTYPTRYFAPMLQRAAAAFRDSNVPLCLSEYGYLAGVGEPLPAPFAWANGTTVTEQAEWLAKGIQMAAELSSVRVQMVMIYRTDATEDAVESGYALIRPDGSCPACDAIGALRQ